jgi:hypothetical protein
MRARPGARLSSIHTMKIIRLPLLAALAATAACNLDGGNVPNVPPSLAIVNASPHSAFMHLHIDGNTSLTEVPLQPRQVDPGCRFILNGTHIFDWVQNDTLYATVQGSLIVNHTYMSILVSAVINDDTTYRSLVAGDDIEQATAGNNGIRIINGTSTAGDVYVTGINDDPTPATKIMTNVGPAATSTAVDLSFHMLPQSADRVRLFDVGSTTNPRSDILLTNAGVRSLTTVILLPRSASETQGGIQVNSCS